MKNSSPLYLKVLKQGWKFTWHHPLVWLFGFFAVFVGHTGVLEVVGKVVDAVSNNALSAAMPGSPVTSIIIPTIFGSQLMGLAGEGLLLIIGIAITILVIIAAVASTGALIHAAKHHSSKSTEKLQKSWHHGIHNFWPLFWVNVGKKILLMCLLWIIALPLTQILTKGGTLLMTTLFIVVFVLGLLAAVVISFLANYASMYVVLEEEHLGRALYDAWKLFIYNWLVSIEMALIFVVIQFVVVILSLIGFALFYIPFFLFYVAAMVLGASILIPIGGMISLIGGILFVFWIGSVYSTFTISSWTILYLHLKSRTKVKSFVHRVFSVFKK